MTHPPKALEVYEKLAEVVLDGELKIGETTCRFTLGEITYDVRRQQEEMEQQRPLRSPLTRLIWAHAQLRIKGENQ